MRILALPEPRRTQRRSVLALAVAFLTLGAQHATAPAAHATPLGTAHVVAQPTRGNVVIEWNRTLLDIVRNPHAEPSTVHPTRNFAIMSAAVYDAVNAISRAHPLYGPSLTAPRDASRPAAAAAAAHGALTALYPAHKTSLDRQLSTDLADIPDGRAKQEGINVGAQAARAIIALRAHDGADATPPPYATTGKPGDYRSTPPAFKAPEFTNWGKVTPFLLRTGHQFRPGAPPTLTSRAYAAAINEVKTIGAARSITRTAEQTRLAKLWGGPAQNYWYDVAQQVALARHSDLDQSADMFALLNLTLADATIGIYDAKYTYRFWRPVTAIRLAADNPQVKRDPSWTPLVTTPPDPSYPGMHSDISTAAATVIARFYGDRNTFTLASPASAGSPRSYAKPYTSLSATATEAGLSRIWGGVHTRLDHKSGNELGTAIARYALGQSKLAPAVPSSPTGKTPAGSASPASATVANATVAVRDSRLGKILVDGRGRTLYLFEADKGTSSTCYSRCATAWPPLTTAGKPQAGNGASPALLGTTARTDHTTQVTYNGHPLYYFVTDVKPGDITGQGVDSFGAKWYVLDPKGKKIETG
ncbi:phosphatase PAP2 family protein [Microtetraspora sp. AC03309]|uniref:phosphatase PAP2 family protein n=1 Tax=Microtetraspora sp. AC03309 TaxID=2779376 RepID=UPI001E46C4F6|nr:phosphatase PAP2 family protein [Microtetraspora sp. AC03309]MCC5575434.1 phosphatase PAP2 family protein [Microtetraspora sp. AC03309]